MKKKIVVIIIILVLLILAIAFINYVLEDDRTELIVIENREEYSDIINFLENTKDDSIIFELPNEGEMQDYNTYYGNKILLCLNKDNASAVEICINKNYTNFLEHKEGDIFESIEKIYYLQKLMDDCSGNCYYNEAIAKRIPELIEISYDKNGFFYYDEFDEYLVDMDAEGVRTVRLFHTMMTLYLCKSYGMINEVDVDSIKMYIADAIKTNNNIMDLYYASLCCKYMEQEIGSLYQIEMCCVEDERDILRLNAYVRLANEMNKVISNEYRQNIRDIMLAYVYESRVSNMMELYVAIDTLEQLGIELDSEEKKRIDSLLKIYQNDDGTFPAIFYYMLDNKQLLMHYQMLTRMGIEVDINEYAELLRDDFENQDYYDFYAYAYFASRLDIDTTNLEKKMISELSRCTLNDKTSIGYLLMAFAELRGDSKEIINRNGCIDENIYNYIQILISSETVEYDIRDLILLYGFLKSELIDINVVRISSIEAVEIEQTDSMQAMLLYYKYEILFLLEKEIVREGEDKVVDRTELENMLVKLRCKGGFKMNEKDEIIDLQATYYLINLIER